MYLIAVYAKPSGPYARGTNPFGRDLMGHQWADNCTEAVAKFAAKRDLDPAFLEA